MPKELKSFLDKMASEVSPRSTPAPEMLRRARRRRVRSVVGALTILVVVASGGVVGVQALIGPSPLVPALESSCSWSAIPSPNHDPSTYFNSLSKVAVVSDTDVWAIGGYYVAQEGGGGGSLILHWDGAAWSIVPHPAGGPDGWLRDISAISANDAWAVGLASDGQGNGPRGLIEHWDGTRWSEVPAADPGAKFWHFEGVAALASNDVWAVGNTATGHSGGTLIEHWDGSAWSVIPSPSPSPQPLTGWAYPSLDAVAVLSANDVWAVGEATNVAPDDSSNTLVEHWDGSTWSVVPSPDVLAENGKPFDHLLSVAASSPNDAWAVGIHGDRAGIGGGGDHVLIEHWNGTSWQIVDSPIVGTWSRLYDVAVSSEGAWAVGGYENTSGSAFGSLVERWDGHAWTVTQASGPKTELDGISVAASGSVWAVGSRTAAKIQQTLILRCR